jgi:hypothetical protein
MQPTPLTVVTDDEVTVDGYVDGDSLYLPEAALNGATGWELKPQGLCRDDECVPVRSRAELGPHGLVDVAAFGAALRRPVALEPAHGLAVVGTAAPEAASRMRSLQAPDFTLPTLDGGSLSLHELAGKKRLLMAFASW